VTHDFNSSIHGKKPDKGNTLGEIAGMANVVQEPGIVSDPTQIDVKLFNRWSFDDVQEIKVLRIRQERELVEGENRRYRQVPEEQEDKARGSSTSSQQQFQIDVACGNHGATNGMALGKGYVNVSTVDVDTSKLISERIKSTGALFLEAPVSGSKKPAEDGQLIFLTAGEGIQAPFHGRSKFYLGDVGNGAAMKLVNMIMGSMMASFSEGLLLSEKVGLDPKVLVEVVSQGAISAPMYSTKGPSMIQSLYHTAFPLKHQEKDLRLALGLAESVSQSTQLQQLLMSYTSYQEEDEEGY
ncbi:hypothetical protein S245_014090, partial [Arachis hypogaea]